MYIEENSKLADVVFPVPPIVVSLKDYDSVATSAQKLPVQGYPLVCVSVSHYSQSYLKGSPKGHKTIVFFDSRCFIKVCCSREDGRWRHFVNYDYNIFSPVCIMVF